MFHINVYITVVSFFLSGSVDDECLESMMQSLHNEAVIQKVISRDVFLMSQIMSGIPSDFPVISPIGQDHSFMSGETPRSLFTKQKEVLLPPNLA